MVSRYSLLAFFAVIALTACTSSQSDRPRQPGRAHYLLGSSALAENNPTEALKEFLLAEKEAPNDAEIQASLAQAYMQKKAFDLAEKHFLKAIDLSDGSPHYQNNLGALYLTMERYDDAIKSFRMAAENLLFATPETAWTGVGLAYFKKQDYAAAEQNYLKALDFNPRFARAHFRLGELYYEQGRSVEAFNAFSRSVELAPRSADAQYGLGLAAMKLKDNNRARLAFQETIKLAPDSEQARLAKNQLKILK